MIYKHAPGQPKLPTGDYLGQFKDEVAGDSIIEFAIAGPKNYGYKTHQGKVECKVRGFSLNARGQEQLNYETLKKKPTRRNSSSPSSGKKYSHLQPSQDCEGSADEADRNKDHDKKVLVGGKQTSDRLGRFPFLPLWIHSSPTRCRQ